MKKVRIIPSKSAAHRALICSMLSGGKTRVDIEETSVDIEATRQCIRAIEAGEEDLYCHESGSTFRFFIPVVGALRLTCRFWPEGRLPERPLSPLKEELMAKGMYLDPEGTVPYKVSGQLKPGKFTLAGNVSSQYVTGLLFALPLLDGDSSIEVTGGLQSEGYVNLTMSVMKDFGIEVKRQGDTFYVRGNQKYLGPESYTVEGDWSNAAFMLAAGLFAGPVKTEGLRMDSAQGDRQIVDLIKAFGGKIETGSDYVITEPGGNLKGITIDVGQIPDMVPALAIIGCAAEGETRIVNAGRLRIKESDRLASVSQVLNSLGGQVKELEDGLVITGTGRLRGGRVSSFNDHRIAMMEAIASVISDEPVQIEGWQAVNKSYPPFFERLHESGLDGNIERI